MIEAGRVTSFMGVSAVARRMKLPICNDCGYSYYVGRGDWPGRHDECYQYYQLMRQAISEVLGGQLSLPFAPWVQAREGKQMSDLVIVLVCGDAECGFRTPTPCW